MAPRGSVPGAAFCLLPLDWLAESATAGGVCVLRATDRLLAVLLRPSVDDTLRAGRCFGASTFTGGRSCKADVSGEADCAADIFGNKTTADTVANAAIRNKPNELTRHPIRSRSPAGRETSDLQLE